MRLGTLPIHQQSACQSTTEPPDVLWLAQVMHPFSTVNNQLGHAVKQLPQGLHLRRKPPLVTFLRHAELHSICQNALLHHQIWEYYQSTSHVPARALQKFRTCYGLLDAHNFVIDNAELAWNHDGPDTESAPFTLCACTPAGEVVMSFFQHDDVCVASWPP